MFDFLGDWPKPEHRARNGNQHAAYNFTILLELAKTKLL